MAFFNFVKKLFHKNNPPQEEVSVCDDYTVDEEAVYDDEPEPESVDEEPEITLEDLIREAIPSRNGLYPHEILMLYYAPTFTNHMKDNVFQQFWSYTYLVETPSLVLKSLEKRGFIEQADLLDTLNTLTVKQLKEELRVIGAKVSGNKKDLVQRLYESGDLKALDKKYPKRYYALTKLGKEELEENAYVPYLHKHPYTSIWVINKVLAETASQHFSYKDCIWKVFNEECFYCINHSKYETYESIRYKMAQFAMDEGKYELALSLLCEFFAYDLSGIRDHDFDDDFNPEFKIKMLLKFFFTSDHRDYMITEYNLQWLKTLQEKLSLTDKQLLKEVQNIFEDIELPRRIFTNEECIRLIFAEMQNDKETSLQIQNQAKSRLKEELQSL